MRALVFIAVMAVACNPTYRGNKSPTGYDVTFRHKLDMIHERYDSKYDEHTTLEDVRLIEQMRRRAILEAYYHSKNSDND